MTKLKGVHHGQESEESRKEEDEEDREEIPLRLLLLTHSRAARLDFFSLVAGNDPRPLP
jgi:hypothetical protein